MENDYCPYKLWKADITEDSSSVSTIRALSRSIEIWVTPLLPSVILHLLEDNARAVRYHDETLWSDLICDCRKRASNSVSTRL